MTVAADLAAFDQKRVDNPEARKLASYPLFDWLRFILAAIVVLAHEGVALPGPIDGGLAVAAFLALSGWLIGGILLDSEPRDLPRFFFNRATRIWLPYLATFALIYGLAAVRDGVDANWLKYAFYDLTFTHYTWTQFPRALAEMPLGTTGNHFWSISVEEQFYLFAPALMFAGVGGKRLAPWVVVAAILLGIGSRFAPVALGLIAAIVRRGRGEWQATGVAGWAVPLACAGSFAALWRWPGPQLAALFAVLLVLSCARVGRRGRIGLFLGAISYPVYLNHWIGGFAVNALAHHVPLGDAVHTTLAFFAGIAAATVLWALVDRPVMARRAGWFTPTRGRALAVVAYGLLAVGLVGGIVIRAHGG
jgi:peptidoglycan/LPS O-acetylase OafA/YrhL